MHKTCLKGEKTTEFVKKVQRMFPDMSLKDILESWDAFSDLADCTEGKGRKVRGGVNGQLKKGDKNV